MMRSTAQTHNQRYFWWLGLGTATLAVALAIALVLQFTHKQAIRSAGDLRVDSITALTFQLEREFLRLRQTMDAAANRPGPPDEEALQLRFDIFVSRLTLLRNNPTIELLSERNEYTAVVPRLEKLIEQTDAVLEREPGDEKALKAALRSLLVDYNSLGPEVQALSFAANSQVSRTIERQEEVMLGQNEKIIWLTSMQLLLLLVAAAGLVARQRIQDREHQALEKLTDDLKQANALAESANRGKSQFLATMSHELRTPFNGLLGMLGLLESTPLTAQQTDYVKTARESAGHLLTLLNDILDVSALESGKLSIVPGPVNLPALLQDIDSVMRPLADKKRVAFALILSKRLPTWVQADGPRIRQILLNLLSNAIKFSKDGQIELNVAVAGAGTVEPGSTFSLNIHVSDQGIGMNADTMALLFRRFSQGDASISRRFGGTGLGLEISRRLAKLMGGDITVQSELGGGSVFSFDVPLACIEAPPMQSAPAEQGLPGQEPRSLDILVAEDHAVNRKYMSALLTKLGHRPRFAEDGEKAVAEVRRAMPDIVLMDLHMPEMDGFEATQVLRAEMGSSLPIVALTADAFAETRDRALAAGMNAFLSKPVRMDQIASMLTEVLGPDLSASGFGDSAVPPSVLSQMKQATSLVPSATAPQSSEMVAKSVERGQMVRRRFRAGEAAMHLDMNLVAEVCVAVSLSGYRALLDAFFGDDAQTMSKLLKALEQGDSYVLPGAAHAIKGAAANLGLLAVADVAKRIESAGTEFNETERKEAAIQLRELTQTVHSLCVRMGLTQSPLSHLDTPAFAGAAAVGKARTAPSGNPHASN